MDGPEGLAKNWDTIPWASTPFSFPNKTTTIKTKKPVSNFNVKSIDLNTKTAEQLSAASSYCSIAEWHTVQIQTVHTFSVHNLQQSFGIASNAAQTATRLLRKNHHSCQLSNFLELPTACAQSNSR